MSFNPLNNLGPKKAAKLTPEQKQKQEQKKQEISGQVKLSFLRDRLLDISLVFMVHSEDYFELNESTQQPNNQKLSVTNLHILIGTLNEKRFEEVIEERLVMKKCANIYCQNPNISDDIIKKAKSLHFMFMDKKCVKVGTENLCFCKGTQLDLSKDQDKENCLQKYEKLKLKVQQINEGGPFGTPMRNLIWLCRQLLPNQNLFESDRIKLQKTIEEINIEINKVSTPNVVERRIVKIPDSSKDSEDVVKNPSDLNFKGEIVKCNKSFNMKVVVSGRRNQALRQNLNPIQEEENEEKEVNTSVQIQDKKIENATDNRTITDSNLNEEAMTFLDDLFNQFEINEQKKQQKQLEIEKSKNYTNKEELKLNPQNDLEKNKILNFMDKPVIKKKVKFEEAQEESDHQNSDQENIFCKKQNSVSGVNQYQLLLEEQIKKEQEEKAIESEDEEDEGEENETLEDQEYGFESDPFEADDQESVKQDIQKYLSEQSQFSKLMLVFIHMTSPDIKNLFSQKQLSYGQINDYIIEFQMPGSPPREFFFRQLRINLDKIKKEILKHNENISFENKESQIKTLEIVINHIEKEIQKLISLINLSTFSFTLNQQDWLDITKIFINLIFKLYEGKKLESISQSENILKEIELSTEQQLLLECFSGI